MTREELDELDIIIRDLRMAMDVRDQIDAGEERGLIDFADGERISVPIPIEAKGRLNQKIAQLSGMLKAKVSKLPVER